MNGQKNISLYSQRGAATLLVAVVLLIAVTLIVIFATRVAIMDQKVSGNQYRHKIAFANAEGGLDQAQSFLRANPQLFEGNAADGWNSCAGSETDFPCNASNAEMVFGDINADGVITSAVPLQTEPDELPLGKGYLVLTSDGILAIGEGESDDGTGAAIAQVSHAETTLLTPGQLPPLMVPSGDLSGNFNVVPNPNGGGIGVPISVWAENTLDTSGSNWKTCDQGSFTDAGAVCMDTKGDGETGEDWDGCSCSVERSNSTNVTGDIVLDDPANFPTSPFVYLFGNEDEGDTFEQLVPIIKARADAGGGVVANCDNIVADANSLSSGAILWVTGDCVVGSNIQVGSRENPIILVVEGDIRVNAGAEFWGIVIGLNEFVLNGGPIIHGSAVSEIESELTNGNYSQVYDESVFQNLTDESVNNFPAKVKYSWRDFTP